jgi:CheY-like chemotaxis protein
LTGHKPFQADSMVGLFNAKEGGKFPSARHWNRDVPTRLDLIIDKMLAKDLRHRHASCAEVVRDLESLRVANERLSFSPLQCVTPFDPHDPGERVEILLVQDDPMDILLAQEGLDEGSVPTNLSVVGDVAEAMAFLHQAGKYAAAPRPNLIIFGRSLSGGGEAAAVAAIKQQEALRYIPLIVLTTSSTTAEVLRARGLSVSVNIRSLGELGRLQQLMDHPMNGSTVAVVEVPPSR